MSDFDALFQRPVSYQPSSCGRKLQNITVCGVINPLGSADDDAVRMLSLVLRLPAMKALGFDAEASSAIISAARHCHYTKPAIEHLTVYDYSMRRPEIRWHRTLADVLRLLAGSLTRLLVRSLADFSTVAALSLPRLEIFEGPLSLLCCFVDHTIKRLRNIIVTETLCEMDHLVRVAERSKGMTSVKVLRLNVVHLEAEVFLRLLRSVPEMEILHLESEYEDIAQHGTMHNVVTFLPKLKELHLFGFRAAPSSSLLDQEIRSLLIKWKADYCVGLMYARFNNTQSWRWEELKKSWSSVKEGAITIEELLS
ncbi:hypothetical protein AAF712_013012 [Marasmius tenuissimus]|uniref:FBD domain-containing protein n=1 Tax=Marasmius tenuissimus TaxID=585030 RepID=A0ABR2ZGZ1_9AGAR